MSLDQNQVDQIMNHCKLKKAMSITSKPTVEKETITKQHDKTTSAECSTSAILDGTVITIWGQYSKLDVEQIISAIYEEIVHWRKNVFLLPSGATGKKYLRVMTKFIDYWNDESHAFKNIALKILMVMPALLLQKPSYKSKSKNHSDYLARRLDSWERGDFDALMNEGRTIQKKFVERLQQHQNENQLAKSFANLMLKGKVTSAIKLLEKAESTGVLPLNKDVINDLREKHPTSKSTDPEFLLSGKVPFVDPVMFEELDESTIAKAALRTKGAAGPSGLDADGWRRMLI